MTPQPGVQLPKTVKIKGGMLIWDCDRAHPEYRRITDAAVLAFAKLADANPPSIRDYAIKYGVLNAIQKGTVGERIAAAGLPVKQSSRFSRNRDFDEFLERNLHQEFELRNGDLWTINEPCSWLFDRKEPIELWLALARRLRAVLKINAALKGQSRKYISHAGGDPLRPRPAIGQHEDWLTLYPRSPQDVVEAQLIFHNEINWWVKTGGVRPYLDVRNGWSNTRTEWKLETAYDGLIGGLAYRLLLMVIGEDKLFTCDGCGQPYIRMKRAPRPEQENFCDDCTAVARKRATQRHRERKRKAK